MSNETVKKARISAFTITLCGLMTALGTALMMIGGYLGVMTFAAPLLAALCLIPVKAEFGSGFAWLVFIGTCVISLIVCPDKEAAVFYVFLGYYPIVKPFFDRPRSRTVRILLKILLFAVSIGSMYLLLIFLFRLDQLSNEFSEMGTTMIIILFAGLVLVMLVFDLTLRTVEILYAKKLRPKLKFPKQY